MLQAVTLALAMREKESSGRGLFVVPGPLCQPPRLPVVLGSFLASVPRGDENARPAGSHTLSPPLASSSATVVTQEGPPARGRPGERASSPLGDQHVPSPGCLPVPLPREAALQTAPRAFQASLPGPRVCDRKPVSPVTLGVYPVLLPSEGRLPRLLHESRGAGSVSGE